MALTKCSECGHAVSSMAAACPGCGAPVAGPPAPAAAPAVITIEQTGKDTKKLKAIGVVSILVGAALAFTGYPRGAIGLFILGVPAIVMAEISAWWNHG